MMRRFALALVLAAAPATADDHPSESQKAMRGAFFTILLAKSCDKKGHSIGMQEAATSALLHLVRESDPASEPRVKAALAKTAGDDPLDGFLVTSQRCRDISVALAQGTLFD